MLIPDSQDVNVVTKMVEEFNGRYSQLFSNFSPILPMNFNKSYLPKNTCEKELIELFDCTVFKKFPGDENSCSFYIANFEQCRKIRDIKIMQGIKEWETSHIKSLDKQNRLMYMQGLTFKLNRLKEEYEKLPSTSAKHLKLIRIQSEIEQTKWRMKNVQATMKLLS